MSPWTPQPQGLEEILRTIHESTDMNIAVQRSITQASSPPCFSLLNPRGSSLSALASQKLNSFTRIPEYIAYLAYILSAMTDQEDRIRTIAGYLLKNNSRLILQAPVEVADYVKSAVLKAFNDSSIMIRNAASQDIVSFLGVLEPRNWPECLQQLVNALDASDLDRQEVSDP
jgi:transportin-1